MNDRTAISHPECCTGNRKVPLTFDVGKTSMCQCWCACGWLLETRLPLGAKAYSSIEESNSGLAPSNPPKRWRGLNGHNTSASSIMKRPVVDSLPRGCSRWKPMMACFSHRCEPEKSRGNPNRCAQLTRPISASSPVRRNLLALHAPGQWMKSSGADLGFFFSDQQPERKSTTRVPHIVRHPHFGQSSPRPFFFKAMCSAINSANTLVFGPGSSSSRNSYSVVLFGLMVRGGFLPEEGRQRHSPKNSFCPTIEYRWLQVPSSSTQIGNRQLYPTSAASGWPPSLLRCSLFFRSFPHASSLRYLNGRTFFSSQFQLRQGQIVFSVTLSGGPRTFEFEAKLTTYYL